MRIKKSNQRSAILRQPKATKTAPISKANVVRKPLSAASITSRIKFAKLMRAAKHARAIH